MTSHGQRGLQLSYNIINLPSVVSGASWIVGLWGEDV